MKVSIRVAIVRLAAVALSAALIVFTLTSNGFSLPQNVLQWLLLGLMTMAIALTQHLGVPMAHEEITFLPVIIITAYLALGWEPALLTVAVGLIVGGVVLVFRRRHCGPWWACIAAGLWPLAHHSLSLFSANWAYDALGATPPLMTVPTLEDTLPIITSSFVYLIIFNLLLILDIWLAGRRVGKTLVDSRRPLLAVQLLPLALAPLSAIAYNQLGLPAFALLQIVLLTIALVVNRLVYAQGALQRRVQQLSSLTSVSQALRTSLELNALLETIYLQIANLLQVKNFRAMMLSADTNMLTYPLAVRRGRREDVEAHPLDPKSFVAWVLRERVPLLALDVQAVAQEKGLTPPGGSVRCWLGVPLLASERVLGCICIWRDTDEPGERTFTDEDVDMLGSVALQAGVAIQNALLYQETQQHASQLATLNQITTLMNASLDPERVLELVSTSATEVAGCDRAAIYLLEANTADPALILAHAEGFSPAHMARSRDISVPLADHERQAVLKKLEAVTIPDVTAPNARVTPALTLLAEAEGFHACAYFPLRAQDEAIGMLAVYYNKPHPFTEQEIELLDTFANQAALAVTNARIYQQVDVELSRRVEQIVKLTDINRRLTSTLDLERIFDLIIDSAMEGCKASASVLVISDQELLGFGRGMSMVAWRGYDPTSTIRAPHHVAEKLAHSRVLQSGETMLVSQRREIEVTEVTEDTLQPRSQLSLPIMLEERVIGAIALESDELNAFSEEDVAFVSQLAAQAAVAIRNAHLYRRAQEVSDRLHAILDAANDGLLMIDAQSRIVMTNTRMGDFWDFARQDFSPRSPEQFLADPLTALGEGLGYKEGELQTFIRRGQREPEMVAEADLYVTKPTVGQRQRFIQRTVTPVRDEAGSFIGLLLVFRDVTEQKELEAVRESLTHMIVHDLRSPLQAVMGSMKLIDTMTPEKGPVIEQATEVSNRALRKLLNLVNDLLDLSTMERGELAPVLSEGSVGAILEDASAELMPLASELGIVVQVEAPDDLPTVQLDRDMIERVVLNLLDNALKYTDPGTLVTLRAKVAEGDHDDQVVRVDVIDNGPGIPDEYKETVFDRFAQVPGRKGRRRSSGIGLAFCRMTITAHGGRIWVKDNPKGGSIFSFTLPISKPQKPAKSDAAKAAPKKKKTKKSKSAKE